MFGLPKPHITPRSLCSLDRVALSLVPLMSSFSLARILYRGTFFYLLYKCHPYFFLLGLHSSARRNALTKMTMPAMSPTMTEGGISAWKKAEGESYSSGDVLLEIVCASFLNSSQRLTTRPCRKPTKRSLTSRHKRMAFSQRSSYVVIL
jgi:hypothetical protein